MLYKKGAVYNLADIISGSIIIAGGLLVALSYVNLGLVLAGISVVFEGIKIILMQGVK